MKLSVTDGTNTDEGTVDIVLANCSTGTASITGSFSGCTGELTAAASSGNASNTDMVYLWKKGATTADTVIAG